MAAKTPDNVLDAIVDLYLKGETAKAAAGRYGRDKIVCLNELKRRNIAARSISETKRKYADLNNGQVLDLLKMLKDGKSQRECATIFGCNAATINRTAQANGVRKKVVLESQKQAFVKDYLSGKTLTEVAASASLDNSTISRIVKQAGIAIRPPVNSNAVADEIIKDYAEGMSASLIAGKYGFSKPAILRLLKRHSVEMRDSVKYGPDVIKQIADDYKDGATVVEVGKKYGIHYGHISKLLANAGVETRKTSGVEWGIKISARCQGVSVDEWESYTVDPWTHFKGQPEYIEWRTQVLKRDGYFCQQCGTRGGELQAHHIFRKSLYPHLSLVLENGITLCKDCHTSIRHKESEVAESFSAIIGSTTRPIVFTA